MQEEVHRLQVRDVSGTEADYKWLTTKFVFDWRWREVSGISAVGDVRDWLRMGIVQLMEEQIVFLRQQALQSSRSSQ